MLLCVKIPIMGVSCI